LKVATFDKNMLISIYFYQKWQLRFLDAVLKELKNAIFAIFELMRPKLLRLKHVLSHIKAMDVYFVRKKKSSTLVKWFLRYELIILLHYFFGLL